MRWSRPRPGLVGREVEVGPIARRRFREVRDHDPDLGQVFHGVRMREIAGLPQVLGRVVGEELDPPLGHRPEFGPAYREAKRRGLSALGLHLAPQRDDRPLRKSERFEPRLLGLRIRGAEREKVNPHVAIDSRLELASDGSRRKGSEDLEIAGPQHDAAVRGPDRGNGRSGAWGGVLLAPRGEDEAEGRQGLARRVQIRDPVGDVIEKLLAGGRDLIRDHWGLAGGGAPGSLPQVKRNVEPARPAISDSVFRVGDSALRPGGAIAAP